MRGRGLRRGVPDGPSPEFGLYLMSHTPPPVAWESTWVRWPDFWVPRDRPFAATALREAWKRSETERVEIACRGGIGRTGTALACLAVLDGLSPGDSVEYVRQNYGRRAVETPGQRRFVVWFATG